tara:strand:- start:137 stop:352 length:216 start_codon:yes stop_codon:yes gene_type:complete
MKLIEDIKWDWHREKRIYFWTYYIFFFGFFPIWMTLRAVTWLIYKIKREGSMRGIDLLLWLMLAFVIGWGL